MEIDLGSEPKARVKLGGDSYDVKLPTALQVKKYGDEVAKNEGKEIEVFIAFAKKLGLPENVVESLTINQVTRLAEGLMGTSKKN